MGIADRNYQPESYGKPRFLSSVTPVTKVLLITNVVVFLLDVFLFGNRLTYFGQFTVERGIFGGRIYEFLTFQFLHSGLPHVLFNSIGLYFFGPMVERHLGGLRFLVFYLLCGIGGALLFSALVLSGLIGNGGVVGASAGIYGLLVAIAVLFPNQRVRLMLPPVELTMRNLALILLGIAVVSVLLNLQNDGGEAGHLGGAVVGFLLTKFPGLISWIGERDSDVSIIRPKAFARKTEAKLKPRSTVDLKTESEVDLILDKVSREGLQSLTDEERAKLLKASNSNKTKG